MSVDEHVDNGDVQSGDSGDVGDYDSPDGGSSPVGIRSVLYRFVGNLLEK
jgi:hypothetical protein